MKNLLDSRIWIAIFIGILGGALGREVILDTSRDIAEWGDIFCYYADITEDFQFWGCPTDLPLEDHRGFWTEDFGFWTECKRECTIEYNKLPSNLRSVQLKSYAVGGSTIQVEVVTAEKRQVFGELDEHPSDHIIDIPTDAVFDDVVITLNSRVGFTLIDSITIDLEDGSSVVFDQAVPEDDPNWESTCLHQVSLEDFFHWGCPIVQSGEFVGVNFWTNCQEPCTITYKGVGSKPRSINVAGELEGDGKLVAEGRVHAKVETPPHFTPISNTREWLDSSIDLSPFQDATSFKLKMTHQNGGFALISRMALEIDDDVTPGPPPTPLIITLDSDSDYGDLWTVNCKYGRDYDDLINNQQCQTTRGIKINPEFGMWTSCSFREPTTCDIVYYGHTNPKPVGIDFRSFVESDDGMNASIILRAARSLNTPEEEYFRILEIDNKDAEWFDLGVDLTPFPEAYVIKFTLSSQEMGSALIDQIVVKLPETTQPDSTTTEGASTTDLTSSTTEEISTTHLTTTSNIPDIKCRQSDGFGGIWDGVGCQMEVRKCPGNQTGGGVFWFCGCDGIFEGNQPKYNCNPYWIGEIEDELEDALIDYPDGLTSDIVDYFLEEIQTTLKGIEKDPMDNPNLYYGQHIERILNLLEGIALNFECKSGIVANLELLTSRAINSTTSLLTFDIPWGQLSEKDQSKEISRLIQNYEIANFHFLVSRIDEDSYRATFKVDHGRDLHLVAGVESKRNSQRLILPSDAESYFELPDGWTQFYQKGNIKNATCSPEKPENPRFTGFQIPSKSIKDKMRITDKEKFGDRILNGNLMTFSFLAPSSPKTTIFNDELKIKIRFKHDARASHNSFSGGKFNRESAICAFWDESNLNWSTEGCEIVEGESDGLFTTCECNHLTSFAMLMGVHEDDKILQILTAVFCGISNIFLGITIYVLLSTKSMANTQGHIALHICSTLFLGNILLVLMNPGFFNEVNKVLCLTTGVALHLVFLWAWAWMAALAFHLFRLVNSMSPNVAQAPPTSLYKLCAYGVPLAWVIGVAGITRMGAYSEGEEDFCWLKGNYIWTFLGPMTILIIFNATILGYAFWRSNKMKSNPLRVQNSVKDKRTSILGWIHLSVTFGLTWAFGYFVIISHSIFFAYAFAILNGLQGLFIFAFHYILKEQFKTSLKKKMSSFATRSRFTTQSTGLRSRSNQPTNSWSNIKNSSNDQYIYYKKR